MPESIFLRIGQVWRLLLWPNFFLIRIGPEEFRSTISSTERSFDHAMRSLS